jgi:4'-phosphopantetheinyl transferase
VIELWVDRVVDQYDPAMLESLTSREVERADRMGSAAARARYVVAHYWLHVRLGEIFDVAPVEVPVPVGAKRALVRDGETRHASFSHHRGYVALALSADASVGVDVLELPNDAHFVSDTGLVLSKTEIALVRSSSPERRRAAFAHCWTRKEAYGKLLGTGLTGDLATITLTPRAPSGFDASLRSYEFVDAVAAVATAARTVHCVLHPGVPSPGLVPVGSDAMEDTTPARTSNEGNGVRPYRAACG